MPDEPENRIVDGDATRDKNTGHVPQMNERVVAQMLEISTGKQYIPTPGQIDRMLSLYEKDMDYTHEENKTYLPKDILGFITFLVIIAVVLAVFIFSAFYAKEYLGEIVSAILGLVAGGAGGYSYGMSKFKKKNKED